MQALNVEANRTLYLLLIVASAPYPSRFFIGLPFQVDSPFFKKGVPAPSRLNPPFLNRRFLQATSLKTCHGSAPIIRSTQVACAPPLPQDCAGNDALTPASLARLNH